MNQPAAWQDNDIFINVRPSKLIQTGLTRLTGLELTDELFCRRKFCIATRRRGSASLVSRKVPFASRPEWRAVDLFRRKLVRPDAEDRAKNRRTGVGRLGFAWGRRASRGSDALVFLSREFARTAGA